MAIDKAVDSSVLNAGLTSIANAIRTKGGTTAQLAFPSGFVSAINAIPAEESVDIYCLGDECEDITGGWSGGFTEEADALYKSAYGTGYFHSTVYKIDVTNFSRIVVYYNRSASPSYDTRLLALFNELPPSSTSAGGIFDDAVRFIGGSSVAYNKCLGIMDVSDLTGSYYVSVFSGRHSSSFTTRVQRITLEK